jgi:hypothetical protein
MVFGDGHDLAGPGLPPSDRSGARPVSGVLRPSAHGLNRTPVPRAPAGRSLDEHRAAAAALKARTQILGPFSRCP